MSTYYRVIVGDNGDTSWYDAETLKLHRENSLPAIELADGTKYWYLNGQIHRVDGPAVEWADGKKYWYLNGTRYSKENHVKMLASLPVKGLTVKEVSTIFGLKVNIK